MNVEQVADRLEIHDLVARYADAVTHRDERAWADTWAEDGEWHVLGRVAKGRDDLVKLWSSLMEGIPFVVQLVSGGRVRTEGDRGTGHWQVTEHLQMPGGAGMLNLGTYEDAYQREGDAWRFRRRVFHVSYMGPPDLSGKPAPRSGG